MPSPLRRSLFRGDTFEGKCCFSICRSACFLPGKGFSLCRLGTRHFGAKVPKAPGFRFPGPQNDSGLAPRPLPLCYTTFLLLLTTFDEGKISSIPYKVPATMPSPLRRRGTACSGLFGQMPSALAPKGTRLSLKMPAAFPKVNHRMRWRGGKK